MPSQILGYLGAVIALVALHRISKRPFTTQRWFVILPIAMLGAALAEAVPIYRAHAAYALAIGDPLDIASTVGEVLGAGFGTGLMVGAIAVLGNALNRRSQSRTNAPLNSHDPGEVTVRITFNETTWKVSRQLPGAGWRAEGEAPPQPQQSGLWFYSDKGESRFLALDLDNMPSQEQLNTMSLDDLTRLFSRAKPQ